VKPLYYNKLGQPITLIEFLRLFADRKYQSLLVSELGSCNISTVWLGLNHNFWGEGPPLIFETMVFPSEETYRYATEQEALTNHARLVEKHGGLQTYISPFTGRIT